MNEPLEVNAPVVSETGEHTKQIDAPTSEPSSKSLIRNLSAFVLACLGSIVFRHSTMQPSDSEQEFLYQYYKPIQSSDNWILELKAYVQAPDPGDIALLELSTRLNFSVMELITVALALTVEQDSMAGRVIAYLQAPLGGSRPTLGLLDSAINEISGSEKESWVAGSIVSGKAIETGVISILNDTSPLPEQAFQISAPLALALRCKNFIWAGTSFGDVNSDVILPESIKLLARQHALSLLVSRNAVLVIRTNSVREARSTARAISIQLQRRPLFISPRLTDLKGLGPLCLVQNLLPVFEYDLAPAERQLVPKLSGYTGAILVITGPDENIENPNGALLQWTIPVPTKGERALLWQAFLKDAELAHRLACDHVHSAGRITELAELSYSRAHLNQRTTPNAKDIRQAAWSTEIGGLGSLAQPITTYIPDNALVLPKRIRHELGGLLQRCKNRESLDETLGITIKSRYQMGVKALLVGPSGTGKTLVASWMASQLGLPLYRVDLASVVSKYIGETEKNLSTLLAKAEQSEILLLFDEADSLFGKRTDIKDSNDRHANSQTNYLLQRIEFYKGIVLLTSNSRSRFDSAFTRRLDTVLEFPLPTPEERRALWQTHLGTGHDLSIKQLNQLAVGSDITGGHIRNAVLTAAVNAKSLQRKINYTDILIGLDCEYRKLAQKLPMELRQLRNDTD